MASAICKAKMDLPKKVAIAITHSITVAHLCERIEEDRLTYFMHSKGGEREKK